MFGVKAQVRIRLQNLDGRQQGAESFGEAEPWTLAFN
jgi:hypothetical protein